MTPASRTGTLARRLLRRAGRGRVLAAITGAIYLRTGDGDVLWIQGRDAPMHRRAIELSGPAVPRVAAGVPFQVGGETLRVGSSIGIGLEGATVWTPEPVDPAGDGRPGVIGARVRELLGAIDATSARELGTLIPSLRRLLEGGRGGTAEAGDPFLDAAGPHAIGAALACRDRDLAALEGHAAALVGLGRGLTPSGDDFVGGLLFVLRRVPGLCPASFAEGACSLVTSWGDRTNAVSFAMLSDHAAGHGNAFEHEIVSVLREALTGVGPCSAVERLAGIGHSSGWDRLAGMVAALSAFRECA